MEATLATLDQTWAGVKFSREPFRCSSKDGAEVQLLKVMATPQVQPSFHHAPAPLAAAPAAITLFFMLTTPPPSLIIFRFPSSRPPLAAPRCVKMTWRPWKPTSWLCKLCWAAVTCPHSKSRFTPSSAAAVLWRTAYPCCPMYSGCGRTWSLSTPAATW